MPIATLEQMFHSKSVIYIGEGVLVSVEPTPCYRYRFSLVLDDELKTTWQIIWGEVAFKDIFEDIVWEIVWS